MANVHRGEVEFEAAGVHYTLRLSTNAIVKLENLLGRGFVDIQDELNSWWPKTDDTGAVLPETADEAKARAARIRIGLVRDVFWAALNKPASFTPEMAGDLMEDCGGFLGVMRLITQSINAANPEPKADDNPPQPGQTQSPALNGAGTGPAS